MRDLDLQIVRLFLHTLAATVWVGGQLTLAGLVGTLKRIDADAPRQAGRAFNRIAWTAYGVLVLTGVWNLLEVDIGDRSTEYQVVLFVKLLVVALSGIGAALHSLGRTTLALAVGGSLAGIGALVALFLGVWLHG